MHAILYAEKITTSPGVGYDTTVSKKLRQENILVELDVEQDFNKIISQLRVEKYHIRHWNH